MHGRYFTNFIHNRVMEGDVQGVRIIPPTVEFRDIDTDSQLYSINITVKNVSKVSKEIRYWPPQDKVKLTYC